MKTMKTFADLKPLYDTMAKSDPLLEAGIVHCPSCGHSEKVDSAVCLAQGWPKHCGATMQLGKAPGAEHVGQTTA